MEIYQYGSRGVGVEYIQLALTRFGIAHLSIDGVFGARTQEAVQAFQRKNGLAADGVVGRKTAVKLLPLLKGYAVHTVRQGDTFFRLSQQYKTDLGGILRANPTKNPENLKVGEAVYVPYSFPLVSAQVRCSSFLTSCILEGLAVRYPFLKLTHIGKSVLGRPLTCIRLGTGQTEVFYQGAHHANEWITTLLLLYFAEAYAEAYTQNGKLGQENVSSLFRTYSLYLLPLANPDGVDLVSGALRSGSAYNYAQRIAAQYRSIPFPLGWKANLEGVDLNLQYPAGWEEAKRIWAEQGFSAPAPRNFVGQAPLCTPESTAIYRFTRQRDFALTLSYHSQGEKIYWQYEDRAPKHAEEFADYFAKVSGYTVKRPPQDAAYAGYKDWFIKTYGRPAFTIEVGKGQNPLPLSDFEQIYKDNLGILLGGMTLLNSKQ